MLEPTKLDGAPQEQEGIAVKGLDAAAWKILDDSVSELPTLAVEIGEHATIPVEHPEINHDFEPQRPAGPKQYKVLCSRAKIFEGKFDLVRLEEVLNDLGRQGWVVEAMSKPHLKDFSGHSKEEFVIIPER